MRTLRLSLCAGFYSPTSDKGSGKNSRLNVKARRREIHAYRSAIARIFRKKVFPTDAVWKIKIQSFSNPFAFYFSYSVEIVSHVDCYVEDFRLLYECSGPIILYPYANLYNFIHTYTHTRVFTIILLLAYLLKTTRRREKTEKKIRQICSSSCLI